MQVLSSAANAHFPGRYWHKLEDGRIQCDVCPRECRLNDEQRGLCFVRKREGDEVVLTTYGRSSGFCIDPIEKKPLNHFLPGTSVLSFGTAGCNLQCKFCQNHDISKAKDFDRLQDEATPRQLADACVAFGAKSIAFTYNDPVIFMEYAIDVAKECRTRGIKTVAVTAGYMHDAPRREFYSYMDAANVDLKAFSESFYQEITKSHLEPVKDTLVYLKRETSVWFEITTLLIPGLNDTSEEIERECAWIMNALGPDVPLHFSAFHPDFKMLDRPATPKETLTRARNIAMQAGLNYVYTGNVHDLEGQATCCAGCGERLIERDWYDILAYRLDESGRCPKCNKACAGVFGKKAGTWGRKRVPVHLGQGRAGVES